MKIGLLQCGHASENLRTIIGGENDLLFRRLFAQYAPEIELVVYDACHGILPQSVDECAGYIITGSKYSVYDDVDWIQELAAFVRNLYERRAKLVGICFGHQMIGHALGGKVLKSERGWGIGIKSAEIHRKKAWMIPDLNSYKLLLSHQDQIEVLPPDAELLAGNEHCPNSMITVGDHFLGIQAHPEFIPELAEALMLSRIERIGQETVEAAQATLGETRDEAIIAQWIAAFLAQT